ncbi:MAG TPA: ABC transporter permease [Bacteroidales bacterium]|nr:ABC transporter permease [Bacteroidales bacterium]HPJ58867.1 ABC transporter permease [Bacteroidales bacterium]
MIKNYLISAYRNIKKNKLYAALNIFGPAIGIICAILILLYVREELTFDRHYKNYHRIYRLESDFNISGKATKAALVPMPMAPTLKDEYPDIEEVVRFAGFGVEDILFTYKDLKFFEDNLYFADSTVFKVFDYDFILGSPDDALNDPNTIVITESFSSRYFGKDNPIGEVLETSNFGSFRITGVIRDVPANSHLRFNCLLSMATVVEMAGVERFNSRSAGSFWNISVFGYVLLADNASMEDLLGKFPGFYEKYMSSLGRQINATFQLRATRIDKVHFNSDLEFDLPVGNFNYIIIFSLVGVLILLIASLNYMNMATARSTNRSKEVGLRKVIGAGKGTLIRQFISESMVLVVIALVIALIATILLLPTFNTLTDKTLRIASLFEPVTFFLILVITLFVGIISGSYPAFYLSSFAPVEVLSSNVNPRQGRGLLRKILVIFQFAVSGALIIGTMIVSGQQRYIRNKDLGLNKENVMIVPVRDTAFIRNKMQSFKDELLKLPDVEGVTSAVLVPPLMASKVVFLVEKDSNMVELATSFSLVDHDFIDVMQMTLSEGRNFEKERPSDLTQAFIINEAAVKAFGWGDNPLGKHIKFGFDPTTRVAQRDGVVIGVVKDFHFTSIHNQIEPFIFLVSNQPNQYFYIRISDKDIAATTGNVERVQQELGNTLPFNYYFFADKLDEMYTAENKLNYLFNVFSLLTIFIACLGLLGLISYVSEQRSREIGIRKIMGAKADQIVWLLNKDFLVLVLISNLISWPFAYYLMDRWLTGFAYRINFGLSPFVWATAVPFVVSLLITLVIAFITISLVSIKAANLNPLETISRE